MKLYVNEKWLSVPIKYYVKDENNVDVCELSYSFGRKITIKDLNDGKKIYIEREFVGLLPIYNININNQISLQMKKEFQWFKHNYILSNGYRVYGNFKMSDFKIYDNNSNLIGTVKKILRFISIGKDCADKYEVDFLDVKQKEIILSIIGVIVEEFKRTSSRTD